MTGGSQDQFDVRCACGAVIHTSRAHVGRTIHCRCGRALTIQAPRESAPPAKEPAPAFVMGRSERSSRHERGDGEQGARRRHRSDRDTSTRETSKGEPAKRDAAKRDAAKRDAAKRDAAKRDAAKRDAANRTSSVLTSIRRATDGWFVTGLAALERYGLGVLHEFTHRSFARRWASRVQLLYALSMFAGWVALITTSEEWLPATLLAYGPRVVVLVPALLVLPLGALFARRSLLFGAVGAYLAVHSIMGFRFGIVFPGTGGSADGRTAVRMMTLNAQGGGLVTARIAEVVATRADVINVQECSDQLAEALQRAGGYHVQRYMSLCTASRWPFTTVDSMPKRAFERVAQYGYGGAGIVVRYGIAHPTRPFRVVNLHLETPRKGLERLIGNEGLLPDDGSLPRGLPIDPSATDGVDINARIRDRESERASVWASSGTDTSPLIIAGDFNMPVESTIYRRYWSAYRNAFEERGRGFGYTKIEGRWLRIRIDHVLVPNGQGAVRSVRVGDYVGSDHRPVVAELLLP